MNEHIGKLGNDDNWWWKMATNDLFVPCLSNCYSSVSLKLLFPFQPGMGWFVFRVLRKQKKTPQRWVSWLRKFKQLNKASLKELPITDRFNSSSNLTRLIIHLSCWELNILKHQTLHTLLAGAAWHLWFSSHALGRDQSLHKHQLTFAWGKPWVLKCFIWNLLCHRNPERHFLSIHTLVLLLQFPFVSFRFSPKECTGNPFRAENQRLLPRRTQSVVKGAPLAISFRTSSSSPLRAASSNLFPRSTKDIFIHGNKYLLKAALKARKTNRQKAVRQRHFKSAVQLQPIWTHHLPIQN